MAKHSNEVSSRALGKNELRAEIEQEFAVFLSKLRESVGPSGVEEPHSGHIRAAC